MRRPRPALDHAPDTATLTNEIIALASRLGHRLFRCNTGQGWVGVFVRIVGGVLTLRNARPFHAGLVEGGSDLIGWTSDGRFLAIEVKRGRDRPTEAQARFIAAVSGSGGVAGVAHTLDEARAIMEAA